MTKCKWIIFMSLVLGITVPAHSQSIIVNHSNWNWYNIQAQDVFDRVGQQKVFFSHASVGANITGGLISLHSNASKFQLNVVGSGGTPPASTLPGTFYEYNRGNPGWENKLNYFNSYVQNGWRSAKVGFSMDKLCYIDQNAHVDDYISLISGLSAAYTDTKFVLWTMPLTTSTGSDNVLRNQYNMAVRNYAADNDVILFDIADIEAWNLTGVQQTFEYNNNIYQLLSSDYTTDGGHLTSIGSQRVATAIYSLLGMSTEQAAPVPIPGAVWLFGSGLLGLIGIRRRSR